MNESDEPDLRVYGRTIWQGRLLILVTVVIGLAIALGITAMQTAVYEATAQLIIRPSGAQQILNPSANSAPDAARNVDTETAVLRSRVVVDAAKQSIGHQPDVSISSSPTSDVVSVNARSTNARTAASDANRYAAAYVAVSGKQTVNDIVQASAQIQLKIAEVDSRISGLAPGSAEATVVGEQRSALQRQLDELEVAARLNQVGPARILANADVPTSPVEPQPVRTAAIGIVLGLLLGVGLVFLREFLDDTVNSREDLERATDGLPVLGLIPQVSGWRDRGAPHLVTRASPNSPAAESYRALRTSVQFLSVDRSLKSIQVTSSRIDDGKTTTIANLAVAFARVGYKVAILCCDLRQPRIHEFFDLQNNIGFTTVLLGQTPLEDALQWVPGEADKLAVLAAGPLPPNPSELLASAQTRVLVRSLESTFDLVLVDSPPILPVTDALIVSGTVDGTLLVASAGSSSRRAVRRSVQVLRQVDASILGTVLNNAEPPETYGGFRATGASLSSTAHGSRFRRSRHGQDVRLPGQPHQEISEA